MGAKRVASAHKRVSPIAAALGDSLGLVKRAERLARSINRRYPDEEQQDAESVLWIAIHRGLNELEDRYAKEDPS